MVESGTTSETVMFDSDAEQDYSSAETLDPGRAREAREKDEPDPLVGRLLADKYEVLGVIGRGGLGTVYKGVQHPIQREVAIKVIARHRVGDEGLRHRFQREALAAAHLKHPSIVALYDFGEDHGELFMVMEFVEGHELRELLVTDRRVPPLRAIAITKQILRGLAHAHDRGLVHRDLKPENVMLSRGPFGEERAQILDFGIVKAMHDNVPSADNEGHETRAGVILGTPAYLAPEQAYARGVGPATDQYSLGVVLYEMLSGKLPYTRGSEFEIMTSHCIAPYPAMDPEARVPPAIEAVVRKAMSKKPGDRYSDVKAMVDALDAALATPHTRETRDEAPKPLPSTIVETSVEIPQLSSGEHALLLDPGTSVLAEESPLSRNRVLFMSAGILLLGGGLWAALSPGNTAGSPDAGPPVTTASTVATPPDHGLPPLMPPSAGQGAHLAGRGGRALKLELGPDAAAPDAAAPASKAPASEAKKPKRPKKPKRHITAKRIQKSCAGEWKAIQTSSKHSSLSKGSRLCKRIARLDRRIQAGRCKEPINVNIFMNLCESGE
jgi:serine/threonine-protein kinase